MSAKGWVRAYSAEAREEAVPAAVASDPVSEASDTPDAKATEPSSAMAEAPPVVGEVSEGASEIKIESADAPPSAAFPKKLKMKKKANKERLAAEAVVLATEDATTPVEGKAAKKAKTTRTREKSKPKTKSTTKNKRTEEVTELEANAVPIATEDGTVPPAGTKTDPAQEAKPKKPQEAWGVQKSALEKKFPEGWSPPKKLSPDAIAGIRTLHAQYPTEYSTEVLAAQFEMSPEAIRRILKSRWRPSPAEEEDRQRRWFERGKRVWGQWAASGRKPPLRWRREGVVRKPFWNEDMTRSGRPRTKEEIEAHRYAKAQRVQNKINETLL